MAAAHASQRRERQVMRRVVHVSHDHDRASRKEVAREARISSAHHVFQTATERLCLCSASARLLLLLLLRQRVRDEGEGAKEAEEAGCEARADHVVTDLGDQIVGDQVLPQFEESQAQRLCNRSRARDWLRLGASCRPKEGRNWSESCLASRDPRDPEASI